MTEPEKDQVTSSTPQDVAADVAATASADDARAAAAAMEALEVNTRWQAEMAQYFQPDGGGTAHFLSQYFYLA